MDEGRIRRVVIAGGGTAGWAAACALTHQFRELLDIVLVESEQIGTVGVGESTIPTIRTFHRLLQIDEREFLSSVAGSFKLSISFENWKHQGDRYFHPFGYTGAGTWSCEFHHFWLDSLRRGMKSELGDYCLETVASRVDRFALFEQAEGGVPQWSVRWTRNPNAPGRPDVNYAYHFDAALYAAYLRRKSEGRGLTRIEGKIREVRQDPENGFVQALVMEDGRIVEGDLFIDCSGFRGLLIEQTLRTGYEDWNQWLPCDRAVALQTESVGPAVPYTRAIAHEAGWRWHIPLQHRVGCGLVFSGRHMSDDEAAAKLRRDAGAPAIRDPWLVPFRTGRRLKAWNKNVVSLGLASGFIEPLESTSIHLALSSVARLIHLFPHAGIDDSLVERYNDVSRAEMEHVRDFIIMHYHLNQRDEPLWRDCREMKLPDGLAQRIRLFRDRAYAWQGEDELFRLDSWTHVMLGQGVVPKQHHLLGRALSDPDLRRLFDAIRQPIDRAVEAMPSHQEFLDRYCKAAPEVWEARKPAMEA
ncbi:tryptophan halogenase family protein [Pseudoxanthomonas putridarboris]|uniref:Tryptophan halogenase family protein n=1 Tax=Pseudoxanthomonas putridarboris TaxID=752605 RepID=A0ABU9IWE2_9GAMM